MGYWDHVILIAGINCILALGFYLTLLTGQLSAAHAAFVGSGSYIAGALAVKANFSFYPSIAAAAVLIGIAAAILGVILQRLSGMFFAIATLGFGEVLIVILKNNSYLGGALGLYGVPLRTDMIHVMGFLAVIVYLVIRLEGSRFGLSFRAIRNDPIAAASIGIDVARTRILSFVLGAIICGIGGALQVQYLSVVEPDDLGFYLTVSFLLFTIVGGRDIFLGSLVGATVFTVLPELLRITTYGRLTIFSIILVIIVIVRPQGMIDRLTALRWMKKIKPDSLKARFRKG